MPTFLLEKRRNHKPAPFDHWDLHCCSHRGKLKIHVDETEVNLKCNLIGQRKLQRRVLFMMDFVWGNYENKDQIQKKIKQWLMIRVKVSRFIEQSFGLCGRRRGWDVSREQHRNMYII